MQVPHKLQHDAFSRGNSNTDSNRDRCARGGRRWLLHAGLGMCMLGCTALMGEFPWLPLQQICPIYLGFLVVIFPLRGFHCSPGAGRASRTGFWSKQGAAVETQPKVFWKSTMKRNLSHLLFVKPSATTLGSPPQHNKHQPHKTNRAERNSSALRYSWAPAPSTEQCAAQQCKTSMSSSHQGEEPQTSQTSPDA